MLVNTHHHINYLEFPAKNLPSLKAFYGTCFGWTFTEYGPNYLAFNDGMLDGGFTTENASVMASGVPLVILYSEALEKTKKTIVEHGGSIRKDIYSFPGGRRFHFADPDGNELAVWGV